MVFGYDNLHEQITNTTAYALQGRSTDSIFTGYSGNWGAHALQLNLRRDDNSQYGSADTGTVGYGYQFSPEWRAKTSYGTSFKAPTFNALYFPGGYGDPNLLPEKGRNTEIGIHYAAGPHAAGVTAFDNSIENFIVLSSSKAYSVPRATMKGLSFSYEGGFSGWTWRTAYDLLEAVNQATGARLPRRPDRQLNASVEHLAGPWRYGAAWRVASDAYDDDVNTGTKVLGGYGTVDIFTRYAFPRDWSLEARVINLSDKFYQTAYGYNQSGRAAYVTLRYQPQ